MKTRKEMAIDAKEKGIKQFIDNDHPCKKCGCVVFFSAGGGRCKDCLYAFTRAKRATAEGQRREKISRKKSYEKFYSKEENRKKRSSQGLAYTRKVKADPERREAFLAAKRRVYRKWYYSEHGNAKALSNVKAWASENQHHHLLRKALERMDIKIGSVLDGQEVDSVLLYSKDDFIKHIESTMQDGMSFDDRSNWHIDHILPVSWFVNNNLLYPELVNSLYNLKAETAEYNLKKNNRWDRDDMTEWEWCYMLQWMVYGEIRYKEGG